MNDPSAKRRSRKTSGRRPSERSNEAGRSAVAELDEQLELRCRLAAIADTIDEGDCLLATANLELLLADLDEARR
jgi:hypothetical protein